MDDHGRQLFHDRDHLSYYGTSMLKESLSGATQDPPKQCYDHERFSIWDDLISHGSLTLSSGIDVIVFCSLC